MGDAQGYVHALPSDFWLQMEQNLHFACVCSWYTPNQGAVLMTDPAPAQPHCRTQHGKLHRGGMGPHWDAGETQTYGLVLSA